MYFHLQKIPVEIFLGVSQRERSVKQSIEVSVRFKCDTQQSAKSDNLDQTIDYAEIYQYIQKFPGKSTYKLIERFHRELLVSLTRQFLQAQDWKLKITKFPFSTGSISLEN